MGLPDPLAERFHLSPRHRPIDAKLTTLDEPHRHGCPDRHTGPMLILEALIVIGLIAVRH